MRSTTFVLVVLVGVLAVAHLPCGCVAADGDSDVLVVTDKTMNKVLEDNESVGVLLEFYAPWCGHCKNLAPTYEKVATALKGEVVVAKVDATENKVSAQRFGVKGYPTVVLAKGGQKFDFSGSRTEEALVEFAKTGGDNGGGEDIEEVEDESEYTGPDETVELTDANFELLTQAATGATTGDWLVMFYAPWCGHCKKLHPTFKRVAADLKGQVNLALVDATQHTVTARRFSVRGYPSVKLFSNGKQYGYKGKRTTKSLKAWATGGFKDDEGEDVPTPPDMWEQIVGDVKEELRILKKDLTTLFKFKKNALIVTFAAGGIAGVLLAFAMFACLGGLSPQVEYIDVDPQDAQMAGQPAAAAINGAGAGAGAGAGGDGDGDGDGDAAGAGASGVRQRKNQAKDKKEKKQKKKKKGGSADSKKNL